MPERLIDRFERLSAPTRHRVAVAVILLPFVAMAMILLLIFAR